MASRSAKAAVRVKRGTTAASAADGRRRFIEAYLTNGGNATNAAMQAGYSHKTAYSIGSRLLKEVEKSGDLKRRRDEVTAALALDSQATLRQARAVEQATLNVFLDGKGKLLPPAEWPAEWRGAVRSYEMTSRGPKITLHDKASARDLLAKYHGLINADLERRIASLEASLQEAREGGAALQRSGGKPQGRRLN